MNKVIDFSESADLDREIFPHSVLVSEPVSAKKEYEEFKDSKFIIYINTCSVEPDKFFTINIVVMDIYEKVEHSSRSISVDYLDSKECRDFITATNIIFEKYNKNILNFQHGESYKLKDFFKIVNDWIEVEIKAKQI